MFLVKRLGSLLIIVTISKLFFILQRRTLAVFHSFPRRKGRLLKSAEFITV